MKTEVEAGAAVLKEHTPGVENIIKRINIDIQGLILL